ncbi:hypothetical protein RJT34_08873 [Clitoria ternatea]|uniref:Glycosyltransferase family 92 protein n=1 Tax=Clitoria ternatea TaxID=43366 RepID=A0AAN9K6X0_CLITE
MSCYSTLFLFMNPFHFIEYIKTTITFHIPHVLLICFSTTMRRKRHTTFLLSLLVILIFATFSLHTSRNAISSWPQYSDIHNRHRKLNTTSHVIILKNPNNLVNELARQTRRVSSIKDSSISLSTTVSILLPDWEILVIVSPNTPLSSSLHQHHYCLFPNNVKSLATFSGSLPFTNRTTFKCDFPESVRRRRMFSQPMLVTDPTQNEFHNHNPTPELIRWNFLVYESFSTDDDVVLFAKGVNNRQRYDRSPHELRCVFDFDFGDVIRSDVTSSVQEVFRCPHPDPSELDYYSYEPQRIKISLEIVNENIVVPSVAYYTPRPKPKPTNTFITPKAQEKHFLCACTMVYNVGKFLQEWVMYHSKVGVDNFVLYDNGSDDDLYDVVEELRGEGYNVTTLFWIWPKTQEAGFSHSVLYSKAKGLCKWVMYVDVDEFVFSPSWGQEHEFGSLRSMLALPEERGIRVGQVSIRCLEFGPSGQQGNPVKGVTQGYTCRRKGEQRHKSVVLVDAVDGGLRNVIHHFEVDEKKGFRTKQIGMEEVVVNHYKYQAWDEFKSKFRRRVSAYVVDWTQALNPKSKDRTPGLGFQAIEPKDWQNRFCEVRDLRLKFLTQSWFGSITPNGYRMAWQRQSR